MKEQNLHSFCLHKRYLRLLLVVLFPVMVNAQQTSPDSLRYILNTAREDSVRFLTNTNLAVYYEELNFDSALFFANEALSIARKNNQKLAEADALTIRGYQLLTLERFGESLESLQQAAAILENPKSEKNSWSFENRLFLLCSNHHMFGLLMRITQNREQEIYHNKEAIRIAEEIGNPFRIYMASSNLGGTYNDLGKLDSALVFAKRAEAITIPAAYKKYAGWNLFELGKIYFNKGDINLSKQYFHKGISVSREQQNQSSLVSILFELTKLFLAETVKDSSLYYAKLTEDNLNRLGYTGSVTNNIGTAYENLYLGYKLNNKFDSAFKYQGLALLKKDSVSKTRIKNLAEFQNLTFNEQLRLKNLEKEKIETKNKIRTWAMLAGLGVFLGIALILYRNNRQKQKANKALEETLSNLKTTQTQLIQSEKMASLGELTAGIAHEIQNPLNFVNNFSEVNQELIEEMKKEYTMGNMQLANEIADDIKENEEKINHHGKRADAIVKSMLQHSGSGTGKKEPTDINALAEEYLRLSYHGLRAKDKTFNAKIDTDLDPKLKKVEVVPQDMGRVLLNLINNAFYAVTEKTKLLNERPGSNIFEPQVSIKTRQAGDKVEITVRDNGNGIAQPVLEKIFQPFYTTKPTGQGTGLGLSLSYDIIKAHGGEIKIETREGEHTSFIIILPHKS